MSDFKPMVCKLRHGFSVLIQDVIFVPDAFIWSHDQDLVTFVIIFLVTKYGSC